MFAYLTDLVRRGVFSKIRAGFLMVGHTHEDIDQFFSVIALYLKQLHVVCPDQPSFLEGICDAFADSLAKPEVVVLSPCEIFDYKMFMTLSLTNHLHTIKSHTSSISSYFMTQLKKTLLFWCTIKCGLKAQYGFWPPPLQIQMLHKQCKPQLNRRLRQTKNAK